MRRILWIVTMLLAMAALLSACGGGSSDKTPPPAAKTISGVAAAGAPIIGSVTIKDSTTPTALTKTVTIAADGKYTVDVSDLKAPYMVRADGYVGGNEYHLYSAATSVDVGGTINITPLTDLIVANIANTVAADYFNSGSFSTLTAAELDAEAAALRTKLLPVLQAVGVSASIDLLRASFSTDHTGLDAALDVLRVETTDPTTGAATITNIITNQQIASNDAAVLTDTTGVATGVTDIQAITAGFNQFSALFATSLPSETNATLRGLFDTTGFLMEGQDLDSFLSEMTTDPSIIGISFTNTYLIAGTAEMTNNVMTRVQVAFDVMQNGVKMYDGPKPFWMIKKADGKWYIQGDQLIAGVYIDAVAEYRTDNHGGSSIITGLRLDIKDRGGKGITSAVVTGAGLPVGGVTLTNNIAYDNFTINAQYQDSLYGMDDTAIGSIADTGELYTVKLYIGTTLTATYTEKLIKRPYLNSQLTAANFPAITAPTTMTQLAAFAVGSGTVTWTMPTGLTNDWLTLGANDNSGNSVRAEYGLALTDTSKSIMFSPLPTFTPTNFWLWLGAFDSFGRQLGRNVSVY